MKLSKKFKKDYKKIQDKLVIRVSRYKADTKSGFQMKMEWVAPSENHAKIFNNMRSYSPNFDKLMTHYSHKIADDLLNEYGDSWLGETVCPIHIIAVL